MQNDKIWDKVLDEIRAKISSVNFRGWFAPTSVSEITETTIVIVVPSAFIKGQLVSRYQPLLEETVQKIIGKQLEIQFVIDSTKIKKNSNPIEEEDLFSMPQIPSQSKIPLLNAKYTLDNFVVGSTNNLAYAAAQAVVQSPGSSYNPLFIYGPSGVGKTHLMQGIGNALLAKNPSMKFIYASSERFTVDYVDSLQSKKTGDFRIKYRNCDLLLIDDVQFIAGKDSTQEEFFHTFNELYSKNSQIILTSDRPPNEMEKLESRLMSRFQGGLMVDIQLPDFETRVAILKSKLTEKGEYLPEECLHLIAENIQSNTRELEGKLIQIIQTLKLTNQPPTIESVQKLLGKPTQIPQQTILDHKKVFEGINHYFNIKQADLIGPRRQKELVLPRQIAMFILYEECKIPMEKIGQLLGGRDHTTVLHGVEKIKEAITRDREVQRLLIEIKNQLAA